VVLGWDPIRFSSTTGTRQVFAEAVLQRAVELRQQEIDAMGAAVAKAVAAALPR